MSVELLSGPLQTERLPNGRRRLLRDYIIKVKGKTYRIPCEGFTTDYSSIPWFGRFVVRWSRVDIAGVVHDYLYFSGEENRRYSDEIWRLVALAGNHRANRLQARICWLALRLGGGPAWKGYREMERRNGFMLNRKNGDEMYDWWWHSLTAEHAETGELHPFFIEYYVVNPALGGDQPVFGQIPGEPGKPSYAMIKAGKWGPGKAQIHNFWGINDFEASKDRMDVRIGPHTADEGHLEGSVSLSPQEAATHPEYMSDPGEMSWGLEAVKDIPWSVGYGASRIFRKSNLFSMFWHIRGMKVKYKGSIRFNGEEYIVKPESSYGYQDKNWGRDYTNPWIWLNCNCFKDGAGNVLEDCSLDIGGGNPRVAGISVGEKILVAFVHEGTKYEFNFTRLFFQKQNWNCSMDEEKVYWDVEVSNRTHRLKVKFSCPKEGMVLVNYENPDGRKDHEELWNGGYASGTVELYRKRGNRLICRLDGERGGCEYGRY